MARRKNTRFIDPRYFMDEKMEGLDEAHDIGQGDAPTKKEIEDRETKCTESGGDWHTGYAAKDPSLGHHGHCKCSDGSTSRVGACKKKKEVNEDLYEASRWNRGTPGPVDKRMSQGSTIVRPERPPADPDPGAPPTDPWGANIASYFDELDALRDKVSAMEQAMEAQGLSIVPAKSMAPTDEEGGE